CSVYSSITSFNTGSTGGGGTSCSAPSNTNTDYVLPTSAGISWEPQADAVNYTVQYRLANSTTFTTLGIFTTPNAVITNLMPGQEYVWRVKASCSPWGSFVQFSTPVATFSSNDHSFRAQDQESLSLQVFPNPSYSESIQVQVSEIGALLYVLNTNGQVVAKFTLNDYHQTISLPQLENGVYFLRVLHENETSKTERLILAK
ncbi:MAG TPA: T9SS type A sorting domain-containing protein, partial [Saprospiraceae bacterium]|nr:T9SS type A sorting domain-containing protein [Saprospiraceae bacterium]HMQ82220.1 T9SS type A sorting domain-containing protein [Saprospiraceae bacterium]